MPNFAGGAPLPVTTEGQGPIDGRKAAVPVYVVSGGQVPIGGRARRVVVVTSGPIEGGAAIPVFDAGPGALYSAEAALPIYIVSGPNLYPLAYTGKIDALGPIAHWPLAESSGSIAADSSGNGRNGTYTNVALGAAGIGDGRTAATFVPASSPRVAVHSASLASAFNGAAGTLMIWAQVRAASVWGDGAARYMAQILADSSNQIYMRKNAGANSMQFVYVAGGVTEAVIATYSGVGWTHFAITWDKVANEVKAYTNGAQTLTTQGTLGTWAGTPVALNTVLGAISTAGSSAWDGTLAHAAVFDRALTLAQIAQAAVPT